MDRFLRWFYETDTDELVDKINQYAEENNLKIISLTTTDNQYGAIVLFEDKKSLYEERR